MLGIDNEDNFDLNYEKDRKIDATRLDVECARQADLTAKYTSYMAFCEKNMNNAKEALEAFYNDMDAEVRNPDNADKYKIDKITDKSVDAFIKRQSEYRDLSKEYIDARFEFQTAKGAVDAFQDRKEQLSNLVKLHGQNYFAGPAIPHAAEWINEQREGRVNKGISGKINSKRFNKN